ncbi:hypothetical protein G6F16_010608 [Rhizopus arrhizus]|nr:hypothetical protein G6F21_009998 [Rhizopus arrhizus]KAG0824011.1 hypothetical protein G6F19_010550 [Rhizopus arrhizus]KAG0825397.1 hypothetical protein G6F18_010428 [Rhizopus arrhizus]KAG0864958.1 hypothetical protein G6F16_010608 [Rhizopus arrhizus]KAG0874970.1 hypothetical protein G6F15_010466 [Rhizopus arrhizus]
MEHLKSHYITPELIQSYELEFNDMIQGDQEHPQIFLSRLHEAADLANIASEAIIESRFRAGLLRDIKQFCIQSSARTFQDWLNHAEGWPAQVIPISNLHPYGMVNTVIPNSQIVSGPNQLSTLEITRNNYHAQNYPHQVQRNNGTYPSQHNHQHDLVNLIQQTIRNELESTPNSNNGYNNNDYNNNIYNNNGYQYNDNNYGRQDYSNQGRNRNNFNNQTYRPQNNRPLTQQPQTQQPNQ